MTELGPGELLFFIEEPRLEFRYAQPALDPRDGLSLFGPHSADLPSHPQAISYGLVGTEEGVRQFLEFSEALARPVAPEPGKKTRLWPAYPGFDVAFASKWPSRPTRTVVVDEAQVMHDARLADEYKRAYEVVGPYMSAIASMKGLDEGIQLIICVVPELVYKNCRPKSHVEDPIGERVPFATQLVRAKKVPSLQNLEENLAPYQYSRDFHSQLKARTMECGFPIQMIRDSTLRLSTEPVKFGERALTPLSDRAWNLTSAIFYKAGGKPWRLRTAREGVCYVGIVFKRSPPLQPPGTACCAAQLFLDDGDGIVLRGDFGPWFSSETGECHLTAKAARALLSQVLSTYQENFGRPLKEVFLHYRVSINEEEISGFKAACPADVKLIAIKIREERGSRLYREGAMPVRRGTTWQVSGNSCYLWASGFKPRLSTYDGSETPVPLRIDIEHGSGDISQVATDILGLTKLNYNECRFGDANPVTIRFSGAVGDILVSNPNVKHHERRFKFYI